MKTSMKEGNSKGKLNEVIIIETKRPDGTVRIQQDFTNCPSLAEQHTAHLTNINYLMEKYQPDELARYLAERNSYRREILGHDFSQEPNLQEAKNIILRSKQEFEELPDEIRQSFSNHIEFLKFIDNPANAEKMLKLGILKPKQLETLQGATNSPKTNNDEKTQTNDDKQKQT